MIPAPFDYVRAESVEGAIAALAEHGDDGKVLAGGHSLLPLMKLRLATPTVLVDIGRCRDLDYIREDGDEVRIGALTRHHTVETSELLAAEVALLAHATSQVGDPQVRNLGTIGGAIAHGDPASDLPAVLLALRATLVARGPAGEREIPVDEFFTGFLETALAPDEVLTEIRVPKVGDAGWSFQKFNRRASDWAIVGVAAVLPRAGNGLVPGVGLVNMASAPVRAAGAEAALRDGSAAADAAARADEGLEPPADLNASTDYRRHLARVLTRRALQEAGA
jgi:carbon-monoxide dehydrogenase medium subunit